MLYFHKYEHMKWLSTNKHQFNCLIYLDRIVITSYGSIINCHLSMLRLWIFALLAWWQRIRTHVTDSATYSVYKKVYMRRTRLSLQYKHLQIKGYGQNVIRHIGFDVVYYWKSFLALSQYSNLKYFTPKVFSTTIAIIYQLFFYQNLH